MSETRINCPTCPAHDVTEHHLGRCAITTRERKTAKALGAAVGIPEVTTDDLWAHLGHIGSTEDSTRIVRQVIDLGWRPVVGGPLAVRVAAHPRRDDRERRKPMSEQRAALSEKRCVFCPIIEGDAPATFVERGDRHVAFVPMGPHVPGHVLFVPTEHLPDATTNPTRTGEVVAEASRHVAERGLDANIITSVGPAATQSVPHLHVHVIPRGAADGLPSRWPWLASNVNHSDTGWVRRQCWTCQGHGCNRCERVREGIDRMMSDARSEGLRQAADEMETTAKPGDIPWSDWLRDRAARLADPTPPATDRAADGRDGGAR